MRVITGIYKGRKIQAPHNTEVRPTTDFAKTGLFNLLETRLEKNWEDTFVLDLFAGFGTISLECLSRGVQHLMLNDLDLKNIQIIKKNFERIGIEEVKYCKEDALVLLKKLAGQDFDLIIADPPYGYPDYIPLIDYIFNHKLLKESGLLVLEHDEKVKFDQHVHFSEHRKYGKVHFSFFKHTVL